APGDGELLPRERRLVAPDGAPRHAARDAHAPGVAAPFGSLARRTRLRDPRRRVAAARLSRKRSTPAGRYGVAGAADTAGTSATRSASRRRTSKKSSVCTTAAYGSTATYTTELTRSMS